MAEAETMTGRRLDLLAAMLPETDTLADIGTDHAKLLTDCLRAGKIRKGIGVEVARGPYDRAKANVEARGYAEAIEIRLGDGLQPLAPGEATACAIAGMGGKTITDILDGCPETTAAFAYLLLQPMQGEREVRTYLQGQGWRIVNEALTEERRIIYPVLLAEKGAMAVLSPEEAEFGPLLLKERPPLLDKLIRQKIEGLALVIAQLDKAKSAEDRDKQERLAEQAGAWEKLLS